MAKLTLYTKSKQRIIFDDADEIFRGGEGRIMSVKGQKNQVAKLYLDTTNAITQARFNELATIDHPAFVVPQELLFGKQGEIVGFLMEYISQNYFPLSTLFGRNFCQQHNIDETIKKKIAQSLIDVLSHVHAKRFIIGDFNPYNVLVNTQGDVKLIDTDSYGTASYPHSGVMLEDIRDYLHGGGVSQESDYFALSVLVFNLFTFTHPFKGIHNQYKNLHDRMIQRLPVFVNTPDLKVPKCYLPLADSEMQKQYNRLYLQGNRFVVSLQGVGVVATQQTHLPITKIEQDNLIIRTILEHAPIQNIRFFGKTGYIETTDKFIVYDASNKGYLSQLQVINKNEYHNIFIGGNYLFVQKDNELYHYKNSSDLQKITNFVFPDDTLIQQYEDILTIIGDDVLFTLHLNNLIGGSLQTKRTEVFRKGFMHNASLLQNTGGVQRIFYNTGKDLVSVKTGLIARNVIQQNSVGIFETVTHDKTIFKYFKINGLELSLASIILDRMPQFAFMAQGKGEGFIFEPADNQIKLIRTQDFSQISTMHCDFVSEASKLQYCQAGIVVWENDNVFLLNSK